MKLIDKSALVAEINRRIKEHHSGYLVCLKDILSLLDTLEVKEVDLGMEFSNYLEKVKAFCNDDRIIKYENDLEFKYYYDIFDVAKYFFELGLQAKNNQDEWNKANTKPPFTTIVDGNKYSNPMLCYDKFGNYCIAQYVRWHTGHCGWYDNEEEVSITHWKELKAQKGEEL